MFQHVRRNARNVRLRRSLYPLVDVVAAGLECYAICKESTKRRPKNMKKRQRADILEENTNNNNNKTPAAKQTPPKIRRTSLFAYVRRKKVRHEKLSRLQLVVKNTENTGEMCARATFHHLFYALYLVIYMIPDICYYQVLFQNCGRTILLKRTVKGES